MELLAIFVMIAAGGAIAILVLLAAAIAQKEGGGEAARATTLGSERDRIATSLLFHVVRLGGTPPDVALRDIRRVAGVAAPVTPGIDITSWGESYARIATPEQRGFLLEAAVQLIATRTTPVPLPQYSALLDLSFALGFHTDALAKLRERYHFEYVDHAKNARPREADRAGGAAPLFVREQRDPGEWLRVLGIEGEPTRQGIISAYRRLASQ